MDAFAAAPVLRSKAAVMRSHAAVAGAVAPARDVQPVALRLRQARGPGGRLPPGQVITGTLPVAEVLRACAGHPSAAVGPDDPMARPGGAGRTADVDDVVRGEAVAVGFKNLMFSEGFDDPSSARCVLHHGVATITCACAEVGQGFVTLVHQIVGEVLGVDEVVLAPVETTSIGSAGSTSASRQTWMSGGAGQMAREAVRRERPGRGGGPPHDGAPFQILKIKIVKN